MVKNINECKQHLNITESLKIINEKLRIENRIPGEGKIGENEDWIICSRKNIIAYLAHFSILQSPYLVPDNLIYILDKLYKNLEGYFSQNRELEDYVTFENRDALHRVLYPNLKSIPEFMAWNVSKLDNSQSVVFVTRYSNLNSDYDFIDLDALISNIINALWFDTREL